MKPRVALIYLSFHSEPYMDDVVSSMEKLTYPKDHVELVVVDNPHPEYGSSVRYLENKVMPLSEKTMPKVTIIAHSENLGFSGGNNVGIRYALEQGFDYVYLFNNDSFVAANFLEPLIDTMENDARIGAAQSFILLHPETSLINSAGNRMHYLGFGFCDAYRTRAVSYNDPAVKEVNYASGAGLIMRARLLKEYGLWDEDFFMYHEDLEYSYRLKSRGYKIVVVKDSIVYHKYQFGRSITKFFWMERNRYGVLLMFYKWPTLFLILPMMLAVEIGLILFALKSHSIDIRIKVYRYWLHAKSWSVWLEKRRRIQEKRTVGDRALTRGMATEILFQEEAMRNALLLYVGNPLMTLYWKLIRLLLWW
ncbi:MAG: glycosyltransferase family 2 protein [Candidatus Magasanikbacteria bacterium]|nr:glycosyltransferase family 2 protein [Candidatus Magasanikbacteria bacterium]